MILLGNQLIGHNFSFNKLNYGEEQSIILILRAAQPVCHGHALVNYKSQRSANILKYFTGGVDRTGRQTWHFDRGARRIRLPDTARSDPQPTINNLA